MFLLLYGNLLFYIFNVDILRAITSATKIEIAAENTVLMKKHNKLFKNFLNQHKQLQIFNQQST